MTRRDPEVSLLHMRDFSRKALQMAQNKSRADLENDEMLRLALTHLVELVGEAAGRVPPEIQEKYPQIPWPKIVGIRNRQVGAVGGAVFLELNGFELEAGPDDLEHLVRQVALGKADKNRVADFFRCYVVRKAE